MYLGFDEDHYDYDLPEDPEDEYYDDGEMVMARQRYYGLTIRPVLENYQKLLNLNSTKHSILKYFIHFVFAVAFTMPSGSKRRGEYIIDGSRVVTWYGSDECKTVDGRMWERGSSGWYQIG